MRKFYVAWDTRSPYERFNVGPIKQEVILNEGEKANPETFAEKIRDTLSNHDIIICYADDIIAWSLIEE